MVTADDFRKWMMDPEADASEVQMALGAAVAYIHGAGVPRNLDGPDKDMAVLQLAGYYWENRAAGQNGTYPPPPPCVRDFILQLRYPPGEEMP